MDTGNDVPRFALTIADTKTTVSGGNGEQYLSITIGADHLADFTRMIPEDRQTNEGKTEVEAMLVYFSEQVAKADVNRKGDEVVDYTEVKIDGDQNQEED